MVLQQLIWVGTLDKRNSISELALNTVGLKTRVLARYATKSYQVLAIHVKPGLNVIGFYITPNAERTAIHCVFGAESRSAAARTFSWETGTVGILIEMKKQTNKGSL